VTQAALTRWHYDDVVGAVAAHGPPGVLGVLCVPFFAAPHCQNTVRGIVFGGGQEAWDMLATQVIGILSITAFTIVATWVCVIFIDVLLGFRSNRATELIGHDYMEHAYEDGSVEADPDKETVMRHSPVRDCIKERILRGHSPDRDYEEYGSPPPSAPASEGQPEAPTRPKDESSRVAALEKELKGIKEDMRLLTTMLKRGSVRNGIFDSERVPVFHTDRMPSHGTFGGAPAPPQVSSTEAAQAHATGAAGVGAASAAAAVQSIAPAAAGVPPNTAAAVNDGASGERQEAI